MSLPADWTPFTPCVTIEYRPRPGAARIIDRFKRRKDGKYESVVPGEIINVWAGGKTDDES